MKCFFKSRVGCRHEEMEENRREELVIEDSQQWWKDLK